MLKNINKTFIVVISSLLLSCGSMPEDAAYIQMGTSSSLFKLADIQYQLPMVVQVTDINGNPAPNSRVSISVIPLQYKKGSYVWLDLNDVETLVSSAAVRWDSKVSINCAAEDANHNGVLDAGEDLNTNLVLDPANPATADVHPDPTVLPTLDPLTNRVTTDDSGYGYFSITYPESVANWVSVRVVASVSVSGTESSNLLDIDLAARLDDMLNVTVAPPGGLGGSPYGGSALCTDIN